jgi:hypothetical protein
MKINRILTYTAAILVSACNIGIDVFPPDDTSDSSDSVASESDGSSGPGATSAGMASSETTADTTTDTTTGTVQCDIVLDDPIETDGLHHFSPCYTSDTFPCTTCDLWCETVGMGSCSHVTSSDVCPPIQGEPVDLCNANKDDIEGVFRCACAD